MKRIACVLCVLILCADWAASREAEKSMSFDARHELKVRVPEGAKRVRVWFTLPQDLPHQQVTGLKVDSPFPYRIERDQTEGSKLLYVEADAPAVREFTVVTTFRLTRREVLSDLRNVKVRQLSDSERKKFARHLEPNKHVIIDDRIRSLASKIVGGEKNTVLAARKIYDYVLNFADYWVVDPAGKKASPVGSTEFCLATKTGNCTDFHSLWTSIARAAGIPTRIVYGSFFKKELDGKDTDQSYHCWTEFYAPGVGWIPQDVAVADLFAEEIRLNEANTTLVQRTTPAGYFGKDLKKVEYYFGNLDERRVTWSVGRDLTLMPKQDGPPVNAIPKGYVEIDGQTAKEGADGDWVRKLTFVGVKNGAGPPGSRPSVSDSGEPPRTLKSRLFEFAYKATLGEVPPGTKRLQVWLPYPATDAHQEILDMRISSPVPMTVYTEPRFGNSIAYASIENPNSIPLAIEMRFMVRRTENVRKDFAGVKQSVAGPLDPEVAMFLSPDRLVPVNDQVRRWALEVTRGKKTDLEKARAIYDYTVATMKYDKSGQGWGRGDIVYACDAKRGNCTDFHAVFIGFARAVGIPARFAIGFPLPEPRGGAEIGGYHCWAEFYVKGFGWVPVDASEAWKNPDKREYFFGGHDENRVQFTIGRDIVLRPKQRGNPLNYFIYPYVEADGRPVESIKREFRFADIVGDESGNKPADRGGPS